MVSSSIRVAIIIVDCFATIVQTHSVAHLWVPSIHSVVVHIKSPMFAF